MRKPLSEMTDEELRADIARFNRYRGYSTIVIIVGLLLSIAARVYSAIYH